MANMGPWYPPPPAKHSLAICTSVQAHNVFDIAYGKVAGEALEATSKRQVERFNY